MLNVRMTSKVTRGKVDKDEKLSWQGQQLSLSSKSQVSTYIFGEVTYVTYYYWK